MTTSNPVYQSEHISRKTLEAVSRGRKRKLSESSEDDITEMNEALMRAAITDHGRHPYRYGIASVNFKGDTRGTGNAALCKLLLGQLQEQSRVSVVFVQECPWADPVSQLQLGETFCYTGVVNEAGIIWNSDLFELKRKIAKQDPTATTGQHIGRVRIKQEEQQTKEKIRQAEQKLEQMQHHSEIQEAMVSSLRAEVTRLRDKDERAQKVLLDHKQEIQQQMEQQTKEKIRQAEQKLEQMQHHSKIQEAMVNSLHAEVTGLREKGERAQKVLLDHKQEIQQLQEANVSMATRLENFVEENEKLRSHVVLLGGEQHADEQTTVVLERTILMFTETVLRKFRQSKPNLQETELAASAGNMKLIFPNLVRFTESELLTKLSCRLGSDWRRLGAAMGIPQSRLDSIQAGYSNAIQRACKVLTVWMGEGDHGLPHDLKQLETVLRDMDRADLLDIVKTASLTTDEAKAAQVVAGNTTLHPADVTPTHVITRHEKGSLWAPVLQKVRALIWPRRGLLTLFKTSITQDAVDVKAHIVSNTKDIVQALKEDMSQIDPKFYWWDSITCPGLRPHQIYCLQAAVEDGTLDLADPEKVRALIWPRRGLLTLFKTSITQNAVDVKAHIVSNTKDIVQALKEDMSQLDPKFYWWDSITCPGLRPHQIYCLQAAVEDGTLDLADPEPPNGLEYEDTLDYNRIYPSFHMTVQRHPDSERLQLNLQLYPREEDNNIICSCRRRLCKATSKLN
uniref:Death domain-containing protein n=1 Tax=Branchiostoma floridae TaxID=7739 RepID=C4A0H9_BRAFL|eukprot:XP_002585690.1 hypothetical protein BRAFLDRAFT_111442 [Branchiostoma floridae]